MSEEWKTELVRNLKWIIIFIVVILGATFHQLDIRIFRSLADEAVKIIHAIKS